jgi:hypothetical protein
MALLLACLILFIGFTLDGGVLLVEGLPVLLDILERKEGTLGDDIGLCVILLLVGLLVGEDIRLACIEPNLFA